MPCPPKTGSAFTIDTRMAHRSPHESRVTSRFWISHIVNRARRRRARVAAPAPASARAQDAGSGTMLTEPVAGLNVANFPAARPVAFTLENNGGQGVRATREGGEVEGAIDAQIEPAGADAARTGERLRATQDRRQPGVGVWHPRTRGGRLPASPRRPSRSPLPSSSSHRRD
jgi:hypothetical protein